MAEFAKVGRVYVHGYDWQAYDHKYAIEQNVKRPLPFRITDAKRIKIDPATGSVTVCNFYSAQGEKHSILKRGRQLSAIKPTLLKPESCVKPAKQTDVKKLLLVIGINIEDSNPSATGPRTYHETVKELYAPICVSDAMDVESDEEDEATVVHYDE